ncbi:transporter substrate-binding domain-containing protein [Barnesiella sp. An55]|uniref:transporter substrate-binding domain-containing protein n=1 Tax=Barnesiella sp. An55 TaxID=1965646 RepID=UPI000B3A7091|nr:transporter substrate-binding domain-containing protein [Barnesiella sp. An55]OUN74715.1 glutamine ABC transporter substrate-binding protein [Barnesiella sp. An55]HIZ27107.1 transporter substrate-binding domain-containing protein [Candidatus Barnesiella merdipullorum]
MKKLKQHLFVYIALLIIVVGIMVWLRPKNHSTYHPRSFEEIENSGVLRIVTDYTPLSYYLQGDSLSGFDYELARMIGERSGLAIEITPEVNLSKSIDGLEEGRYDIIARQLPVTSEIKEELAFTVPIQLNRQVLVQRKEEGEGKELIRNQLDLAGKTLYIVSDAPTRLRINNLAREIGDTIYIHEEETYGAEQLIMMVATGEIEFAVCDKAIAQQMSKDYPQLDCNTDISFTQFQSWALRKNDSILLDSMNKWITDIQKEDRYKKLYDSYF